MTTDAKGREASRQCHEAEYERHTSRASDRARMLEGSAGYTCPSCFEANFVGVDPSGGRRQRFIEDCPVCCRPIEFEVAIDREGDAVVERAELAE
jgi:hypothetical protein